MDNETVENVEDSDANKELEEQMKQEQDERKKVQEKKRADDLWSSFMSDVGKRPEKKPVTSAGLGSLTSSVSKVNIFSSSITRKKWSYCDR